MTPNPLRVTAGFFISGILISASVPAAGAADSPYPFRVGTKWVLENQGNRLEALVESVAKFDTPEGQIHGAVMRREDGSDRLIFRTEHEWYECQRFTTEAKGVSCLSPFQFFKWPLKAGDRWSGGGFDFAVLGRESRPTPVQEFPEAWKISYASQGSPDPLGEIWVAEGVGRVSVREGEADFELVRYDRGTGPDLSASDPAVVRKILENARAKGPQEVPTPNRAIRMLAHIRNSRVFPVVLLQALVLGALLFLGFGVWHAVRAQRKLVDLATAAEPHEEARLLVSLVRGGDVKQAEARLREMVGLHPTYPDLRHHLATLLQSQGKLEEARDHWKAALESNPDYADARIELGHLLLMLGPAEEAVEHFRHVTLRKPAFADAHVGLAQALLRCGRAAEAVTPLQTALEINPSLREATELLAKCRTDAAGPKLGTS